MADVPRLKSMLSIDDAWRQLTDDAPPIAHQLRTFCADRWIRFHSLPESKRYADSESEYVELLGRHNTLISSLCSEGDDLHLVTASYSDSTKPSRSYAELTTLDPAAVPWRSVRIEHQWHYHVYISRVMWSPGCLDSILRLVADDVVREVTLVAGDARWAYHPYDGGSDLICGAPSLRDTVAANFSDWLSQRPDGL